MPKRTTPREIARFLRHLSDTGNFALACARTGRGKAGLYKRRAADPVFAQQCDAAITIARARLIEAERAARDKLARPARHPHPSARLRTDAGDVELSVARHRAPQLRRTAPGRLTPAGIDAFLAALAATGNVRLSAQSVGVAPSSIYARYRRHEAFRTAMDEALQLGCDHLEMAMLQRTMTGLTGTDAAALDPLAPYDAPADESRPEPLPARPELVITSMSVDDALRLLKLHRERTLRPWRPKPTWAEVAPSVKRKVDVIIRMREK